MNELKLNLRGGRLLSPTLLIDGKVVKCKRNKYGSDYFLYKTEKDVVNIKVYRYLELNGKHWFLWALLFYIISFFGLFEPGYNKRCIAINTDFDLKLNQNTEATIVIISQSKTESRRVSVEAQTETYFYKNSIYEDNVAKHRRKILLTIKIITWVLLVILCAALVFLGVNGYLNY